MLHIKATGSAEQRLPIVWVLALIELIGAMLLTAWLLTLPTIFRVYYPASGNVTRDRDANAIVEWLAGREPMSTLNAKLIAGTLTEKELNHYLDVREVFRRLPALSLSTLALGITLVLVFKLSRERIESAQWRAFCALVILSGGATAFALWDWKIFFAWLHYPLFGETSWRFSRTAYSLRLFPASFWQICGASVIVIPGFAFITIGSSFRSFARLAGAVRGGKLHRTSCHNRRQALVRASVE